MTAGRGRLSASVLLALVFAGVGLMLGPRDARAAASPLGITAHVGYANVIKVGEWMPVSIAVTNSGPEVDGSLEVQAVFGAKPGTPWPASYGRPLVIGTGATKYFRTYLVEEIAGQTVTVRIVRNGRILASQDASGTQSANTLIGVLSDDSAALDGFAAIHPGGLAATVVHLGLADLADSPIALRAFDLLAVDDIATDGLTASQRTAIADFVQNGGSLLIGTGASWRRTLAGLPPDLLPMQVSGLTTLDSSPALGGLSGVQVATGSLTGGVPWLSERDQPLLAERTVGSGSVTLATFDWKQDPISGWSGTQPLLRQILVRSIYRSPSQQSSVFIGGPISGPFGGQGNSVYQRSNALSQVLGNLPGLDLPSLALTGVVVLVYVLLVGPINFFVLRALHRRALAWITLPLIAVLVAGGAYTGAILTKGQSVQTNQVSILHVEPGTDRAYQETYIGVLTPTRGDYQVSLGQQLLVGPISSYSGFGGSGRTDIGINDESSTVTLPGMIAFTPRGFATEGMTAAPRLSAHLQEVNGQLVGLVENQSSTTFTDAVLVSGDAYQKIGALPPGASARVALTPKTVTLNGPPAIYGIYPNTSFGPPPNLPAATLRDGQTKTSILSLIESGSSFKGVPSDVAAPVLVAWTKQSFAQMTVNGGRARAYAETAVAMTLPIDQVGAGALPAGIVGGRIVDLEGDTQSGPPGTVVVQNGTVTYLFKPALPPGAQLSGASLSATNLLYAKAIGGPAGSGSTLRGEAWDWSSSTWVDIAYQDGGTTALPAAAVNSATGEVRLRVTVGGGSFLATGISLVGTVR
jgi:hypothetical protein